MPDSRIQNKTEYLFYQCYLILRNMFPHVTLYFMVKFTFKFNYKEDTISALLFHKLKDIFVNPSKIKAWTKRTDI
ncbi:hypothetical protein MASR1M65_28330 [Saprospiraceae bacterium]